MKYLKAILWLTCSGFCILGCSQSKSIVSRINAVYTIHLPGNVAVDPQGNEISNIDTAITVYVQTVDSNIIWESAWMQESKFDITAEKLIDTNVNAGISSESGEPVNIKTEKNNILWRLDLSRSQKNVSPPKNIDSKEILIEGKYEGKSFYQTTTAVEIQSLPRY